MQTSMLKPVGIGIVAENKLQSKNTIMVTNIEAMSFMDGELKSNPTKLEIQGKDSSGNTYQVDTMADQAIEADWLPIGQSNRKSAPDMRRGERVMLYQFADNDQYYWTPLGIDEKLRKLETVIYGFSSNSKEEANGWDRANMYFLEVSTHQKHITLITTNHEGEKARYAIQLNTKDGIFLIADDQDNELILETEPQRFRYKNASKTKIEVEKEKITMECNDIATLKAGKTVSITAGSGVTVKAPEITLDGKLKVTGESTFSAAMKANGIQSGAPIQGPSKTI